MLNEATHYMLRLWHAGCDMLGTSYQLHPNNNPHFDATHDTSGDSFIQL